MRSGDQVTHQEFGHGTILEALGTTARVSFLGEELWIPLAELTVERPAEPAPARGSAAPGRVQFRRAFEAVNLGVVPPHPDELLALSVGAEELATQAGVWLGNAQHGGLCKAIFGDYGLGKSHYLRVIEAVALKAGWAVSFVEFDPKQADPAKPHLVYASIMAALRLPQRQDGTQARGIHDFVGEVRRHWDRVADAPHLLASPWFGPALSILRKHSHDEDREYADAIGWLFGQIQRQAAMHGLARRVGMKVPRIMPRSLETSEIYVHHLVVVNEICRRLNYQGLLILLDEAEHVRGFAVRRRERATSLFDALAQAAHRPSRGLPSPASNEHGISLPRYWEDGPHFGLVVALTEGDTFAGHRGPLRDACVFLHHESDLVRLSVPSADEYCRWCLSFFERFAEHYPAEAVALGGHNGAARVAEALADEYRLTDDASRTLRLWTKLGSFVLALLMAKAAASPDDLIDQVRRAARKASGRAMPWET